MELVPQGTVRLLKACNATIEILDKVAKDRDTMKEDVKPMNERNVVYSGKNERLEKECRHNLTSKSD